MTSEPPKQGNSEEAAPPTANKTGVLEPSQALAQQESDSPGTTAESAENHDTIGFADELSTKEPVSPSMAIKLADSHDAVGLAEEPCTNRQYRLSKKWQEFEDAIMNLTDEEYQARYSRPGE